MKVCSKCKIEKEDSEFRKNKYTKSKLQSYCKECDNRQRRINRSEQTYRRKKALLDARGVTFSDPLGSRRNPDKGNQLELQCSTCKRWLEVSTFVRRDLSYSSRGHDYTCARCKTEKLNKLKESQRI